MLTSNYSAEYGLSSAATMTAVIRSGQKQFHASAWEFLRNDALDARNYFNRKPDPVAELRFHTYGFNVGGQVPLWKSHPTFFFYNMEWRSLIQGQVLNQTVPVASEYRMRAVQARAQFFQPACVLTPLILQPVTPTSLAFPPEWRTSS